MATQNAMEVPFSASHTRQAFKLLELPAEVLALLESDNPPILHLRTGPSGNALLTTPTTTYRVQQKNSSNPIMIISPSTTAATSSPADPELMSDAPESTPEPSVTIIAKIEDTLELYLEKEDDGQKAEKKVNKWHEKFAKSRTMSKG